MYRNYKLNELRIENVGEEVVLSGWISKIRDKGHFVFIDLRDRYGVTQIFVNEEVSGKELFEEAPQKIYNKCKEFVTKIAPIVSSAKSASVILRLWDRNYKSTADMVVIEGPLAGGHLGFSNNDLHRLGADTKIVSKTYLKEIFDKEIEDIIKVVSEYENKYEKKIPVIVAGGDPRGGPRPP